MLTGTEEQLFARALEYVPPQAAAELAEVAQVGVWWGIFHMQILVLLKVLGGKHLLAPVHTGAPNQHLCACLCLGAAALLCPFDLVNLGHWVDVYFHTSVKHVGSIAWLSSGAYTATFSMLIQCFPVFLSCLLSWQTSSETPGAFPP